MPLHRVILPPEADLLMQVVELQRALLRSLCDEATQAEDISVEWLQWVWPAQEAKWVEKFCRAGRQNETIIPSLKVIAGMTAQAKAGLRQLFEHEIDLELRFHEGGRFTAVESLPGLNGQEREAVKSLFKAFYLRFGHNKADEWPGYNFPDAGGWRSLSRKQYADAFLKANQTAEPPLWVCPFCDGQIENPPLDHYYPKGRFPLFSCHPENLVPICTKCNEFEAKGEKIPLNTEEAEPAADWLHPYFRTAPDDVFVELTGVPPDPVPKLVSPTAWHQKQVGNHAWLVNLESRWQTRAAQYFASLRAQYMQPKWRSRLSALAASEREDHRIKRGIEESSLLKVAVCQAILDDKPGYRGEISRSRLRVVG